MDNLRGLLSIRSIDKVPDAQIRAVERMENDRIGMRFFFWGVFRLSCLGSGEVLLMCCKHLRLLLLLFASFVNFCE